MTREKYAVLVDAFVKIGGPVFARVAKEAGLDRETVKKGWDRGWPEVGDWAAPISARFKDARDPLVYPSESGPGTGKANDSKDSDIWSRHDHTLPYVTIRGDTSRPAPGPASGSAFEPVSPPSTPVSQPTISPDTGASAPTTDMAPATAHPAGWTAAQAKARDREPTLVLAASNLTVGLSNAVHAVITALTQKAHLLDHLGEVGDGKGGFMPDPHAAKHYVEALASMVASADKLAQTTLKIMEAGRLNTGEAQSITEERGKRSTQVDPGEAMAAMARMAAVAASAMRGRAIATHYKDRDEAGVIDATVEPATPAPAPEG